MDFDALQSFLRGFVLTLLAWTAPADPVVWEDDPRPRDNGRIAILSWVSGDAVGVDEVRYDDSGAAAPALPLTPVVVGDRVLVLQVAIETLTQKATGNATFHAERARTRLRLPASKAALRGANVGLVTARTFSLADRKVDSRLISRAVLEVRLNAVAVERDATDATGAIASLDLTSNTLTGPDGADLPAAEQIDHEVIP